jgi:hypothetical protein
MHWRDKKCVQPENRKGSDHLGDLSADGRIILSWIFKEMGCEGVNWVHLVWERVLWRTLMNKVMNRRIP